MPTPPPFQHRRVYDKLAPFFKKKVYECPDFSDIWHLNVTHVYGHIFRSDTCQAFVFINLHKAGFLMMRVICLQITEDMKGSINSKNSI